MSSQFDYLIAHNDAKNVQFSVLLLEANAEYAATLKTAIESRLPVLLTIVTTVDAARTVLNANPNKFFIGITSILNLDSSEFEKVDLLAEFNVSVIALVSRYQDDMRDQLIKHHVIDYVVKDHHVDSIYICDLILRVYKNASITVLVVDDSKVSRFVMARELALQKFNVLQAANGYEALSLLSQPNKIKLVLVDNQMPGMDGYTFVTYARDIYLKDELSIIGVSGSSDPRIAVKFLKAGANDFIAKPFNYEILLCRITQNLDMLDAIDFAKDLSNTDFLTGLNNRRYFFEQGEKLLKNTLANQPLTLMMMDIDFFKKINDQYGHDVGDEVIKNFANLLKDYFAGDIVARVGGEEFIVISQSPKHSGSFDAIDTFRQNIANQQLTMRGNPLQYTCSIGICSVAGITLNEMMQHADKHLYIAKQTGRNQVYW